MPSTVLRALHETTLRGKSYYYPYHTIQKTGVEGLKNMPNDTTLRLGGARMTVFSFYFPM